MNDCMKDISKALRALADAIDAGVIDEATCTVHWGIAEVNDEASYVKNIRHNGREAVSIVLFPGRSMDDATFRSMKELDPSRKRIGSVAP